MALPCTWMSTSLRGTGDYAQRWCSSTAAVGTVSTRAPCVASVSFWHAGIRRLFGRLPAPQRKGEPLAGELDDVQRAVRWVRANAATYGVNPERIGAFGHSAGAQLAALLGMEETRDNSDAALAKYSSKVQAVVDVSGPTDFTADRSTDGAAFFENFLGAPYAADPGVWRDASPAFHISKDNAPFLIVHGTEDESVPIGQAQKFYEKMQAAGVVVKFIKVNAGRNSRPPKPEGS